MVSVTADRIPENIFLNDVLLMIIIGLFFMTERQSAKLV